MKNVLQENENSSYKHLSQRMKYCWLNLTVLVTGCHRLHNHLTLFIRRSIDNYLNTKTCMLLDSAAPIYWLLFFAYEYNRPEGVVAISSAMQ